MRKDDFDLLALAIIQEIPCGKVATYGQIAKLMGYPNRSRLVGKACSQSSYYGDFPCHRVVTSKGQCAKGWDEQKDLLLEEGIEFLDNGHVNLKKYTW